MGGGEFSIGDLCSPDDRIITENCSPLYLCFDQIIEYNRRTIFNVVPPVAVQFPNINKIIILCRYDENTVKDLDVPRAG